MPFLEPGVMREVSLGVGLRGPQPVLAGRRERVTGSG